MAGASLHILQMKQKLRLKSIIKVTQLVNEKARS